MSLFFFWRAVCFSAIMQKFCAIALSYWLPVLAIRAKATMRNIFNSKKFIKTYGYPYNYQVCYYLFLLNTYTYPGCVAGVLDVVDNIIHHDGNLPVHITHHVQRGTFLFSNTLYIPVYHRIQQLCGSNFRIRIRIRTVPNREKRLKWRANKNFPYVLLFVSF